MASEGPFRGLVPFDESARDRFFGRATEREELVKMVLGAHVRVGLLTGLPGVGKTSLVRAGLIPQLSQHGALAVYLTDYADIERDLGRALASAAGLTQDSGDAAALLVQLAGTQPRGAVLIFDHLGDALERDEEGRVTTMVADFMTRVARSAGERVRFLLVAESIRLMWVSQIEQRIGTTIPPSARYVLEPMGTRGVAEIVERTVLAGGTYFEEGLSAIIASDLTQRARVPPAEIQMVCKTAIEMRVTTAVRYRAVGGASVLSLLFIDRGARSAGGEPAARVLSALVGLPGRQAAALGELAPSAGLSPAATERAAVGLVAAGIVRRERAANEDRFALAHEYLKARVRDYVGGLRGKMVQARLVLQRRAAQRSWLRPLELRLVKRYAGFVGPEEERLIRKSLRLLQMAASALVFGAIALFGLLYMRAANSYQARLEDGRVVVRLARPTGLLGWLPHSPAFGAVLGDTGVPATSLLPEARARYQKGAGGLVAFAQGHPSWLQETLAGMQPLLRGSALAVAGQAQGYSILKEVFREGAARRDVLSALARFGRGEAAENEILMAALADENPDLRRRAVEVAATIDARRPSAHVEVLQAALRDKTSAVGRAVVRASERLAPEEAATLLGAAVASGGPIELRRAAVEAAELLAQRDVAAAADAVRFAVGDADPALRKSGLMLMERLLAQAPGKVQPVLERVVADETSREEVRVAALVALRRGPSLAPNALAPVLARAVAAPSEKLRAAALPLYARVGEVDKVVQLATQAQAGAPSLRAAAAAAFGALAARKADVLAPLKTLTADLSLEVRIEATRALTGLGKEGVGLLDRASRDGNLEVERAAVEALATVGKVNPYGAAGVLEKVLRDGRSSLKRSALEALGVVGEVKPSAVTGGLAKAIKEPDPQVRQAAVGGLCAVGRKAAAPVLGYLRVALRDADAGVRMRVASCAKEDPALGARLAGALVLDADPGVRAATADALGAAGAKNTDPGLLAALVADKDRRVRLAALRAAGTTRVLRDPDKTLLAALAGADVEEKVALLDASRMLAAAAPVRAAAVDRDPAVRRAAMAAAGGVGERGVPLLAAALDDTDASVRVAAMRALGVAATGAGGEEVAAALERIAQTGAPEEREAAMGALAGAGAPGAARAGELIGETLGLRSEALRGAAARAAGRLAELDAARAVPLLERALSDSAHDVRRAATPGLALAYARSLEPAELARRLGHAEDRAALRAALLEALARQAARGERAEDARRVLERVAAEGGTLARFGAAMVRGFGGGVDELDAFLAEIAGG